MYLKEIIDLFLCLHRKIFPVYVNSYARIIIGQFLVKFTREWIKNDSCIVSDDGKIIRPNNNRIWTIYPTTIPINTKKDKFTVKVEYTKKCTIVVGITEEEVNTKGYIGHNNKGIGLETESISVVGYPSKFGILGVSVSGNYFTVEIIDNKITFYLDGKHFINNNGNIVNADIPFNPEKKWYFCITAFTRYSQPELVKFLEKITIIDSY